MLLKHLFSINYIGYKLLQDYKIQIMITVAVASLVRQN